MAQYTLMDGNKSCECNISDDRFIGYLMLALCARHLPMSIVISSGGAPQF